MTTDELTKLRDLHEKHATPPNVGFGWGELHRETVNALDELLAAREKIKTLEAENARLNRVVDMFTDAIVLYGVVCQSTYIESQSDGAEKAMRWIENTLHNHSLMLTPDEVARSGGAQAWYDARMKDHDERKAKIKAGAEIKDGKG